jgi:hypothetical protein
MLHKDYYRKTSVGKKQSLVVGVNGAWRKDELIGSEPPVVK